MLRNLVVVSRILAEQMKTRAYMDIYEGDTPHDQTCQTNHSKRGLDESPPSTDLRPQKIARKSLAQDKLEVVNTSNTTTMEELLMQIM